MAKFRSGEIRINISDVLDQIDDDDLLAEVKDRALILSNDVYAPIPEDEIRLAYYELLANRPAEARAILERLIKPKWSSVRSCEVDYSSARKRSGAKAGAVQ